MTNQQAHTAHQPQSLLSAGARIAVALAVTGFVSAAWMATGHESERAVQSASAALHGPTQYVRLPTVEVVGQREAATEETAVAFSSNRRLVNKAL